jgi:glycosyltransferase involved in cell wall biosynthesis
LKGLRPGLVRWDRRAASSADTYLANSRWTREVIQRAYGIDAEILHPPHSVDEHGPQRAVAGLDAGFHLCVSRLLGYKHVDAVLEAFATMPSDRIVIVGSGPDAARLRGLAPTNALFCEAVSDDELRWLYANARAVVAASFEDFGLVPVEAAVFGTPSIVLRFGGYLDTVIEGETGIFFDRPSAGLIAAAVHEASRTDFDPVAITAHSQPFGEAPFLARLRQIVHADA